MMARDLSPHQSRNNENHEEDAERDDVVKILVNYIPIMPIM